MAIKLNDIDPQELARIVKKYGEPKKIHFATEFQEFECNLVKQSVAKGRHHDITCFIRSKEDQYITIQKHAYAETGIYRAPSGGANQGESLESAARREMLEETGMEIRILRFVLDSTLDVMCLDGVIPWRSLVFLAEPLGGNMVPQDTFEIYDVKISTREEMVGEISELMEESGWGGFKYRAHLTRAFFKQLEILGI
ncbi:MAG: NUDIX hydrolase [Candidatus Hodarchaeota archaeon]